MNELDFKIPLTKFFSQDSDAALNFEFPFDFNRRRCDLLVASRKEIIGIEIKSDIDNLERLDEQLFSYYKCFNKVYVACGKRHYKEISKINGRFGIIYIADNKLTIKRKARVKKNISVLSALDMCDKNMLEKWSDLKSVNKSDLILKIMKNFTIDEIHSIYRESIYEKVSRIYDVFLSEKGSVITSEDITLLSLKSMKLGII